MKKALLSLLLLACCVSSVACGTAKQPGQASGSQHAFTPTKPEETMEIPFDSEVIRINALETQDMPFAVEFVSSGQLQEFFETQQQNLGLGGPFAPPDFITKLEKYTPDFFKDKALMLAFVQQSSGSTRHKVAGLQLEGQNLVLKIHPIESSGMGTMDMAQWAFFIEYPAEYAGHIPMVVVS